MSSLHQPFIPAGETQELRHKVWQTPEHRTRPQASTHPCTQHRCEQTSFPLLEPAWMPTCGSASLSLYTNTVFLLHLKWRTDDSLNYHLYQFPIHKLEVRHEPPRVDTVVFTRLTSLRLKERSHLFEGLQLSLADGSTLYLWTQQWKGAGFLCHIPLASPLSHLKILWWCPGHLGDSGHCPCSKDNWARALNSSAWFPTFNSPSSFIGM